jgi:hypothetical protein
MRSRPKAMPPCGGAPVGEGLEHVAETALDHVGRDLEHVLEHLLLQGRLVDADRAAAELHAVEDDVVMLAAHRLGSLSSRPVSSGPVP